MASKFDVNEFVTSFEDSPSETKFNTLKRTVLFDLAKHYNISVLACMKKADLKAVLTEYFVDESMLETQTTGTSQYSEKAAIKLKELELQIQIEQRKKAELGLAKLKQPHPKAFDPVNIFVYLHVFRTKKFINILVSLKK